MPRRGQAGWGAGDKANCISSFLCIKRRRLEIILLPSQTSVLLATPSLIVQGKKETKKKVEKCNGILASGSVYAAVCLG